MIGMSRKIGGRGASQTEEALRTAQFEVACHLHRIGRNHVPLEPRMIRPLVLFSLLALTSACAEFDIMGADNTTFSEPAEDEGDYGNVAGTLRVDVFPSYGVAEADADGTALDLLPRTFEMSTDTRGVDLVLEPPVLLEGYVTGYHVAPTAASGLPGVEEPVAARVGVRREDSVQSRATVTADDGYFQTLVVPDVGYRLDVTPDDPEIALYTSELHLLEDTYLDLHLVAGSALWGQVIDGVGNPLVGVEVYAESVFGAKTAADVTDVGGEFLIRVQSGAYSIVAEGRNNGRDPTVATELLFVGEEGSRIDVVYPNLDFYSVGGRMTPENGTYVRDGAARFTAVSLDGYPNTTSLVVEARTDDFGNFDTRLLAGTYEVELFPSDDQELTPVALGEVTIDGPTDLGSTVLPAFTVALGSVSDPTGGPVAGALLDCVEISFAERVYTAHTDEAGQFGMMVPQMALECDLVPPAERGDLALTPLVVDLAEDDTPELTMEHGQLVTGTVRYTDGGALRPLEFAVVEVRDAKGQLLGTALTNIGDGSFSLRVTSAR